MTTCHTANKFVTDAQIEVNAPVTTDIYRLTLDAPALAGAIKPGQFVEVGLNAPDLPLRRPFSVFQCDAEGKVEILYQVIGEGTRRLAQMVPGERLSLAGPLGNCWLHSPEAQRVLLIGGGIGVAPLALYAQQLAQQGTAVTLVQGAVTAERLLARDLFESLCEHVVYATDDGTKGTHGLITQPLAEVLAAASADKAGEFDHACICGPEPMQAACAELCLAAGLTTFVSLERLMACGVGACLSCVVPTTQGLKRVCADGPIFPAEEVLFSDAKPSRIWH